MEKPLIRHIHFKSTWKVFFGAKAIYSILKRMHRAARIPDDDAEALQIGANRRQWYRWKGSHFLFPHFAASHHWSQETHGMAVQFNAGRGGSIYHVIIFVFSQDLWSCLTVQPGHYGLRLSFSSLKVCCGDDLKVTIFDDQISDNQQIYGHRRQLYWLKGPRKDDA